MQSATADADAGRRAIARRVGCVRHYATQHLVPVRRVLHPQTRELHLGVGGRDREHVARLIKRFVLEVHERMKRHRRALHVLAVAVPPCVGGSC